MSRAKQLMRGQRKSDVDYSGGELVLHSLAPVRSEVSCPVCFDVAVQAGDKPRFLATVDVAVQTSFDVAVHPLLSATGVDAAEEKPICVEDGVGHNHSPSRHRWADVVDDGADMLPLGTGAPPGSRYGQVGQSVQCEGGVGHPVLLESIATAEDGEASGMWTLVEGRWSKSIPEQAEPAADVEDDPSITAFLAECLPPVGVDRQPLVLPPLIAPNTAAPGPFPGLEYPSICKCPRRTLEYTEGSATAEPPYSSVPLVETGFDATEEFCKLSEDVLISGATTEPPCRSNVRLVEAGIDATDCVVEGIAVEGGCKNALTLQAQRAAGDQSSSTGSLRALTKCSSTPHLVNVR